MWCEPCCSCCLGGALIELRIIPATFLPRAPPPPHKRRFLFVLDGEVSVQLGKDPAVSLHANDFAYVPPDMPHRWVAPCPAQPAMRLCCCPPGLQARQCMLLG